MTMGRRLRTIGGMGSEKVSKRQARIRRQKKELHARPGSKKSAS